MNIFSTFYSRKLIGMPILIINIPELSINRIHKTIETNEYNFMMRKYIYCQIRLPIVKVFSVLGLKKIMKSILGYNKNNI